MNQLWTKELTRIPRSHGMNTNPWPLLIKLVTIKINFLFLYIYATTLRLHMIYISFIGYQWNTEADKYSTRITA